MPASAPMMCPYDPAVTVDECCGLVTADDCCGATLPECQTHRAVSRLPDGTVDDVVTVCGAGVGCNGY